MRLRSAKTILAAIVVVAVAVVGWFVFAAQARCVPVFGGASISINVAKLKPGQAQTYCYTTDAGQRLRFILARGADGKVRSVFDACRQCYVYHRGFSFSHNQLICRVCGNHYPMEHMTEGKASCVPATLAHESSGGMVIIRTADLKSGKYLF